MIDPRLKTGPLPELVEVSFTGTPGDWLVRRPISYDAVHDVFIFASGVKGGYTGWKHARLIPPPYFTPTDADVLAYIRQHGKRPSGQARGNQYSECLDADLSAVESVPYGFIVYGLALCRAFEFRMREEDRPHA